MPPYGILVPGYEIPKELYGYVRKNLKTQISRDTSCKMKKSFLIMNEALV